MKLKMMYITLALFHLQACHSLTTTDAAHLRSDPPANMTAACPPPELLPEGVDMGQLLQADAALSDQYWQCAHRHNELVKWLNR